ncbi:hypothetical protein V8E36_006761 [Tilletia maclaganii]
MYFRPFVILPTLLSATASVKASNSERARQCEEAANTNCPSGGINHQIYVAQCLAIYWKSISGSKRCSHPELDCACFNGCLADVRTRATEFCMNSCSLARREPGPCN